MAIRWRPSSLVCATLCVPVLLLLIQTPSTLTFSFAPPLSGRITNTHSRSSALQLGQLTTESSETDDYDVDQFEEAVIAESLPTSSFVVATSETLRGDAALVSSIPTFSLMLVLLLPVLCLFSWDTANAAAVVPASVVVPPLDWSAILQKAANRALGGGTAGASAAVVQVCTLMWLRTCMNYQYRYGGTLLTSLQTLWQQGGVPRLYQGLPFAIVQGPLTRFGDTAANVGVLSLLEALPETRDWPLPLKTLCGSLMAGLWRILLMPIDASKTAMQVQGAAGLPALWSQAAAQGPGVLYRGAFAQAAATAVGHFPWFLTYNFFNDLLPLPTGEDAVIISLARSAALGFLASTVSDCCSNSLRVIKTTKQTAQLSRNKDDRSPQRDLSYPEVVRMIVDQDGLAGLFGRGLQTRLLTNAIQGAMFSVLWKYFQQQSIGS